MSIDQRMVLLSRGLHSTCFSKDQASVADVERLASLARTEVPFSRLFLAEHHFETPLVNFSLLERSWDFHFLYVAQTGSGLPK